MKSLMCNNCGLDELNGFAQSQDKRKRGIAVKLRASEAELLVKRKDLLKKTVATSRLDYKD